MKHILRCLFFCLLTSSVFAQERLFDCYEVTNAMPVCYEQIKAGLTYPLAWNADRKENFNAWKAEAQQTLLQCMENHPPQPAAYEMVEVASQARKGYTAHKILFNVSAWSRVPAYLLIPDGKGSFPAIAMLHDHGAHFTIGKEKLVQPFDVSEAVMQDAETWSEKCYDGRFIGDYFAAHGYVVLVIDALFWGERGREQGADYDAQQALASNLLQMGTSWGGVVTMDDVRSVEFLASLPQVDSKRIASLGFSMGGYRSWMLAASTELVAVSASIGWMNTTEHLMTLTNNQNKGGSAFSMLVPGLRRYMDYPHVASIACPKPALFFNGLRDKLFPVQGVEDAYRIMREVWQQQHADDKLVTKLWDEKHFFSQSMQEEVLMFFERWLK